MTSRAPAGRTELLQAAAEQFALYGFSGATTGDIARQAGVTQPLVHHHFGSKKGLWDAVIDELFSALDTELQQALKAHTGSEVDRLRELLRVYVRFCGRYPHLPRMIRLEGSDEVHEELHTRWLDRFIAFFRGIIEQAQASGALKPVEPQHLYFVIVGAATEVFAQPSQARRAFALDLNDPAVVERHAQVVVDVIFTGLLTR
jgi:AcrR family transcriptional regulator